ncbi:MAG: hemin uptake protein HemP [Planctomycetaceae bacterium]|nr:hemin uptake protein HemP [Planctomycetaceae bacterium]
MSADEQSSETPSEQPPDETPDVASPAMADTLCYAFEKLSTGSDEVQITFQGQIYRLRKTRNGRLIMTK